MTEPTASTATAEPTGLTGKQAWRRLLDYVRPHRGALIAALALGLVGTAAELVGPLVTRSVLAGIEDGAALTGPVLLLVGVLLLGTVVGYAQTVMLGVVAERIIRRARATMLDRLLHARLDALAGREGGEMVSRVTSDTTLIREASTTSLVYLVSGSVSLLGTLALMAYLDLVLFGATVVVIILGALLAVALMPALAKLQQQVQEQLGLLGGRLDPLTRAMRTVKSARAEEREFVSLDAYAEKAAVLGVRAVRLEAAAWTLTGVAINLVVLVVLGFGAIRVSSGDLDVPSLVAYLLYVFGLMWPVMMLTMGLTSLQSGIAAVRRIDEVTSLPQEADEPSGPIEAERGGPVLRIEGVDFRYGPEGPAALAGLDLVIPRRGHTALIGPSGAGKSTVFSLLLKFFEPASGRVLLDGVPYEAWTRAQVRGRVGYVEQDTPIIPGTVRDNVLLAHPGAPDEEVWEALGAVRLDAKVASLPEGIASEVSATQLSGGERQRLAIARAMLARPEVLLLDEATAQLDALTEAAIASGVRALAERGAVVSIAHRLSTVMDADQIVVLDAGTVRAVGTHAELLATDELYAELIAALRIGVAAHG